MDPTAIDEPVIYLGLEEEVSGKEPRRKGINENWVTANILGKKEDVGGKKMQKPLSAALFPMKG